MLGASAEVSVFLFVRWKQPTTHPHHLSTLSSMQAEKLAILNMDMDISRTISLQLYPTVDMQK